MVTDWQMDAPEASTRSTPFDLAPTPCTLAVMIEPAVDPELGVIAISLAVKLILAATFSFPFGAPTRKNIFELLKEASVTLVI